MSTFEDDLRAARDGNSARAWLDLLEKYELDPDSAIEYAKCGFACRGYDNIKYRKACICIAADIYAREKADMSAAIKCYKYAFAIDPTDADVAYRIGKLYGDLLALEHSEEYLRLREQYLTKAVQLGSLDAKNMIRFIKP